MCVEGGEKIEVEVEGSLDTFWQFPSNTVCWQGYKREKPGKPHSHPKANYPAQGYRPGYQRHYRGGIKPFV